MLFSQCLYDQDGFKRCSIKTASSCLRRQILCFNAIYRPRDSPELPWILSYEPVHVKTVVKLDGGKEKQVSHGGLSQAVYTASWVVI